MLKDNQRIRTAFYTVFCFLLSLAFLGWTASNTTRPSPSLLLAAFKIEPAQSDMDRPAREYDGKYTGPLIDTHVHLDPPRSGHIRTESLHEILQSIDDARVRSIVVMPVPNEGKMKNSSIGAKQREMLRQAGPDKVKIFCGSEYISNWLHDAYHRGYSQDDLEEVLRRLSRDMDNPECLGIGEIGLYHFNKDGIQNVIEYPPTFEPFLEIIRLIAEKGIWIDLHAEPFTPDGESYENQVFGGLELLFQKYPNLKLILSHTGMTNSPNARRILKRYPNIMMNFKPITRHNLWKNLEPITNTRGRLYNDWAELLGEMPERFMIGTDEKFGRIGKGVHAAKGAKVAKYEKKIRHMRKTLGSLDPQAAEQIAYRNAERIFK